MAVITAARIVGAPPTLYGMATGAAAATWTTMVNAVNGWKGTIRPTSWFGGTSSGEGREIVVTTENKNVTRNVLGTINGTVKVNGVLKARARVYLLDRHDRNIISSRLTDLNGAFLFPYLDLDNPNYLIVATDPANVERAEAYDRVIPL